MKSNDLINELKMMSDVNKSSIGIGWPNSLEITGVEDKVSIILHYKAITLSSAVCACTPNCIIWVYYSIVVDNNVSVILVDQNWVNTVVPVRSRRPESVSGDEMFGSVDDKIAVTLENRVVTIGWLDELPHFESLTTFQVGFSLQRSHRDGQQKDESQWT